MQLVAGSKSRLTVDNTLSRPKNEERKNRISVEIKKKKKTKKNFVYISATLVLSW